MSILRPSYSLFPAARRIACPRTTLPPRYNRVHTPTSTTTTTRTNQLHALPLSDAQRKTIYALSTPPGKSGIAVIRVSGPDALTVWQRMVRPARAARTTHDPDARKHNLTDDTSTPTPERHRPETQRLERCRVVDPHTTEHLDDALAVFFRGAPASLPTPPTNQHLTCSCSPTQPPTRSRQRTS